MRGLIAKEEQPKISAAHVSALLTKVSGITHGNNYHSDLCVPPFPNTTAFKGLATPGTNGPRWIEELQVNDSNRNAEDWNTSVCSDPGMGVTQRGVIMELCDGRGSRRQHGWGLFSLAK